MSKKHNFSKWRNATSIETQLILSVGILTVLLATALIIYSYSSQIASNLSHEKESINRILELETNQFDNYFSELADFSLQLRSDTVFMQLLSGNGPLSYDDTISVESSIRNFFYSRRDIVWAEVFIINHNALFKIDSTHKRVSPLPYYSPEALSNYQTFTSPPAYISVRPSENGFMEITRTIIDSPWKTPYAVVRLLVDYTVLDFLRASHNENNEELYIYDKFGNSYSDSTSAAAVYDATEKKLDHLLLDSTDCLVLRSSPGSFGFSLSLSKPLNSINSDAYQIRNRLSLIGISSVIFSLLLIIVLMESLTRPLRTLANTLKETGEGAFYNRTHLQGSSEISGLSDEVNQMNANISELIDKTYIATLNERTAQLTALEAQTNPHFLFNTLQTIGSESLAAGNIKVYGMITSLASLLRYTIRGGTLSSLQTEIDYTTNI